MKKVFGIAAMLLALSACNKVETEIQPVPGEEGITITATLAPKGANTKAVADGGDKITVTWAVNEHIAILYTKDGNQVADATITAVDGSGAATITFTVEAGTANDTPCTLVYPLSAAKDDHSGVKDAATLLAAQDGTLNANLDVRVGAGTIQTTTPGLTVSTQPEPQYAIFKFTTKNSDGSATINVTSLTITIGTDNFVITHAATSELFAALPAIASQAVTFTATGSDTKTYTASKASVTFSAGYYYQSVIKMTEAAPAAATGHALSASAVGEVVGTDGLAYDVADKDNLPTGVTAAGMVAYKSGSNGLVIALADEASTMFWSTANGATTGAAAHTPAVTGQAWKLPSQDEWKQMFSANGGNEGSYSGLNTAITNAGGTALLSACYWSSTEHSPGVDVYFVDLYDGDAEWYNDSEGNYFRVRACLAF